MALLFTWDPEKAKTNLAKHAVAFDEALTVFADPLAKIFPDEDHSPEERREIIVGYSVRQRLLVVSFHEDERVVRVISARTATARERRKHEARENRG
jgi:uncharacterized protein